MPCLVEIGSVVQQKKIFFNFVSVFSLFRNYLLLEKGRVPHLNKLQSPLPIVPSLVEIGPKDLEKKIFKFPQCIFQFRYYLPFEKDRALHLKKFESLSPKDDLYKVWMKLVQWLLRRRFLNFVIVFLLFRNHLPLEKVGPFIHTNLNLLYPRMHCAKLD